MDNNKSLDEYTNLEIVELVRAECDTLMQLIYEIGKRSNFSSSPDEEPTTE